MNKEMRKQELINEYKNCAKKVKYIYDDIESANCEFAEIKRLSPNTKMRVIELAGIETIISMKKHGWVISTTSESYYYTKYGEIGYANTIKNQRKFK